MTTIDLFREFSLVSTREKYTPSSRILYYTLLYCWNEQRRPEIAMLTMNELCTLTGLPRTTIQSAFAYLADRGWVKRAKSRNRQIFGWIMRDCRQNVGRPADFPITRAQSESKRRLEESPPKGDSSKPVNRDEEVPVHVREHNIPCDTRPDEGSGGISPAERTEPSTNARIHEEDFIEVPEFER